MNLVGVQIDVAWENKDANFTKVHALLEKADLLPGSLVVLPEMFATGYSMNAAVIAEEPAGMTRNFLQEMSTHHQCWIMGGVATRSQDGHCHNEALVIDPSGKETARYAKMHPFTFAGEALHYAAGDRIVHFNWQGFTASPFICYDLRFPEIFRRAVQQPADLFLVIACWPNRRAQHWITLLQARAIENQAYVVGVNRCGTDPYHTYSGHSLIMNPHGEIVADAGEEEQVIKARPDLNELQEYRRAFPAVPDMRAEFRVKG